MGNCFHKDTEWMRINPDDKITVEELIDLDHPLKNAPYKLIFSDILFCLPFRSNSKSVIKYRYDIEEKLAKNG